MPFCLLTWPFHCRQCPATIHEADIPSSPQTPPTPQRFRWWKICFVKDIIAWTGDPLLQQVGSDCFLVHLQPHHLLSEVWYPHLEGLVNSYQLKLVDMFSSLFCGLVHFADTSAWVGGVCGNGSIWGCWHQVLPASCGAARQCWPLGSGESRGHRRYSMMQHLPVSVVGDARGQSSHCTDIKECCWLCQVVTCISTASCRWSITLPTSPIVLV